MTRILDSGMPVIRAMKNFRKCGTWVVDHIVYSPIAGVACTTTLRGSIALGISRGCR
jgi:hypothetical protein